MIDETRKALDVRLDDAAREGLTGTTPANAYAPARADEGPTRAPDGRPMDLQPPWRRDFPIDWQQDDYVSRRDFGKFLVLTSLAFAVGQLWIVAQSVWRRSRPRPGTRRIASLADLAVGGSLVFRYPAEQDPCVLVRLGERELVAYSQKCTHLSCAVIPEPAEGRLVCPCHRGFFDLRSGAPLSGPPPRPLPRVLLELRGDDVYATGIETRAG